MENLLLLVLLGVAFSYVAGTCNLEKVGKCLGDNNDLILQQAEQGLTLTMDQLDEVCESMLQKKKCAHKLQFACKGELQVQKTISAINAFAYICGNPNVQMKYQESLTCVLDEATIAKRMECSMQQFIPDDNEHNCRVLQESMDCTKDTLEDMCGAGAAQVHTQFSKIALQYLSDKMDCYLSDKDAAECNIEEIRDCLADHTSTIMGSDYDKATSEGLDATCNALAGINECLVGKIENCKRKDGVVYELPTLIDELDAMCSTPGGREAYLEKQHCIGQKSTVNDLHNCGKFVGPLTKRGGRPSEDWCQPLQRALSCGFWAVKTHCGSDAADDQLSTSVMLIQHLSAIIDCDLFQMVNDSD